MIQKFGMKIGGVLLLLLLSLQSSICAAKTFSGYTLAPAGAWCWFADPRAIHYRNEAGTIDRSFVGYIDVLGNIKGTQFNWLTGKRSDVIIRSGFERDDHDNPTFLVLPDQRILIIYSQHSDEPAFYYRISTQPGDITQLGAEHRIATSANTTYPSPFILSCDPTHWYLAWRGIGWHPTIARLTLPDAEDNVRFDWGPFQMVQTTAARPYAKYYSDGKDKIYMSYTTGHPDNETPNWLYYNVINIQPGSEPILEDIKGNKLSVIKDGPFAVNKTEEYKAKYPTTVVDDPGNGIRDWIWQLAFDGQNRPCIAFTRITPDKSQHEYCYAKWDGSKWNLTDLADGGGKFHMSETEYCYSGGLIMDQQDPSTLYLSIPTQGDYGKYFEIWRYTLNSLGKVASREQVTYNSKHNNVRPYVLPNSKGTPLRLVWMNGEYQYWAACNSYPLGFPTSIMCDYRNSTTK